MEEVFVILSANLIILVIMLLFLIDLLVEFGIIIVPSNLFDNVNFLRLVVFKGKWI